MLHSPVLGHLGLLFGFLAVIVSLWGVESQLASNVSPAFFFALLVWGVGLLFVIVEAAGARQQR
ncbi:MAG: hypothetical protein HY557_01210 [Euryarchaeota archaeon]|nr:hypothetical protein [Euryarchaeota archaeon]